MKLKPEQVHKLVYRLKELKRSPDIHWETVVVHFGEDGCVWIDWEEDQGEPYLQRVPCSEMIFLPQIPF